MNKTEHFASRFDFADNANKVGKDTQEARPFNGNCSLASAIDLARNGWKDGAERVMALADKLQSLIAPALQNTGLEHVAGSGSLVDVDRFISGDPEHFMEFAPAESRKHVTIEANCGADCTVPATELERRGAAVLAAVLAMKARGISCDIVSSAFTRGAVRKGKRWHSTGHTAATTVTVHNRRESMDVESLAFALVHPAMLRQLILANWDALPSTYGINAATCYGFPTCVKQTVAQAYVPQPHKGNFANDDQALTLALSLCRECGAQVETLENV
jgi:hypothetical protein